MSKHDQELKDFFKENPALEDATAPERKYGDFIFDSKYRPLMDSGKISYRKALDATAADVYEATGDTQTNLARREALREIRRAR